MAEAMLGINGEIIRWAREYYNMQPPQLSALIYSVTQIGNPGRSFLLMQS